MGIVKEKVLEWYSCPLDVRAFNVKYMWRIFCGIAVAGMTYNMVKSEPSTNIVNVKNKAKHVDEMLFNSQTFRNDFLECVNKIACSKRNV